MQISELLLVSDIDGTLLPREGEISVRNREAIRRFRELGGGFTLVSGRSPTTIRPWEELLEIDGPVACSNGALIYDRSRERIVRCHQLPDCYRSYLTRLLKVADPTDLQVVDEHDLYYNVWLRPEMEAYFASLGVDSRKCSLEELPERCCKVVLQYPLDRLDAVAASLEGSRYPGAAFVRTGGTFFEMMPANVDKGTALPELAELWGKRTVAAIGDFYNDIPMLRAAEISAAVQNAPPEVRAAAHRTFPSCEEDGVAAFIEFLIANSEHGTNPRR